MPTIIAAILAGGEGTRFRPYTEIIPKPMIPLGPEEKPILEYIVSWIAGHGIRDIVLLVGYRWRQIANYFHDGARWGVGIRYSIDDERYHGTGGSLVKARRSGLLNADTILVWYGDILAPLDIHALLAKHENSRAQATLVLADRYQVPVGVARLEGDDIIELREKPWLPIHVTIGVLALNPSILDQAANELGTSFDIMADLIPWMIRQGMKVKAYIHQGPWYDVGSLERYKKLDNRLLEKILAKPGKTGAVKEPR